MAKYGFQLRISNDRYEDLQHIPGQFGSVVETVWTPARCEAGFLCNKGEHMATGGYKMTVAADGSDELYACNPSDVQRISDGNGNLYAVGVRTLGLGIPAGVIDTYTHLVVGETYAFGPDDFSTLVTTTNKYATVSSGKLVGSSSKPDDGSGFYFELDTGLGIDTFTEGNYGAFERYNLILRKAPPAAPSESV